VPCASSGSVLASHAAVPLHKRDTKSWALAVVCTFFRCSRNVLLKCNAAGARPDFAAATQSRTNTRVISSPAVAATSTCVIMHIWTVTYQLVI
jgi:hypothetical protein